MEVVASLSQCRTAAAQCGLFTHKSVPLIFEPPCILQFSAGLVLLYGSAQKCACCAVLVIDDGSAKWAVTHSRECWVLGTGCCAL